MFEQYLKKNWRRLIFIALFFFFVTYLECTSSNAGIQPYIGFFIKVINSNMAICYYFMIAILVANAEALSDGKKNAPSVNRDIKVSNRWHPYLSLVLNCVCVILLFCTCTLISYILAGGSNFSNAEVVTISSTQYLSGTIALVLSITFVLLRCLSLSFLMALINRMTSKMTGFIAVILITIIDRWLYEAFDVANPLGVLPIEHSRVFYTEAVAPMLNNAESIHI